MNSRPVFCAVIPVTYNKGKGKNILINKLLNFAIILGAWKGERTCSGSLAGSVILMKWQKAECNNNSINKTT